MVELIDDGDLFYEKLWDMIDQSKVCCWILSYHIASNTVPNITLEKLIKAAERGVNVVLMVDSLNFNPNYDLISELESKGGIVRPVNPMLPHTRLGLKLNIFSREIFERYHQKVFIIDDSIIIGSANLDDAYAGPKYGHSNFYDLNIIIHQKCIEDAQTAFEILCIRYGYDLDIPKIEEIPDENYEILVSEPYYMRWDIQQRILEMIKRAQSNITVVQGYYYNIPKLTKALKDAVNRGVNVELITSKRRDQLAYRPLLNSWLTQHLKDIGVKVYEFDQQILHMKAFIIDDSEFTIGSFNSDMWSWKINNELNLYVNDQELSRRVQDVANRVKDRSTPVVYRDHTFKEMAAIRFWDIFLFFSVKTMAYSVKFKYYFEKAFINDGKKPLELKLKLKRQKEKLQTENAFNLLKFDLY